MTETPCTDCPAFKYTVEQKKMTPERREKLQAVAENLLSLIERLRLKQLKNEMAISKFS